VEYASRCVGLAAFAVSSAVVFSAVVINDPSASSMFSISQSSSSSSLVSCTFLQRPRSVNFKCPSQSNSLHNNTNSTNLHLPHTSLLTHCLASSPCECIPENAPIQSPSPFPQQVRMTKDHFEPLALIGRGAFGEVRLVRKKDRSSQDIYGKFDVCSRPSTFVTCALVALKSMVKDHMIKKNQVAHVRAERDILTEAETENPWIVTLYYSFQVTMLATPRIE
jgi:hypothetical protein